MRRWVFFLTPVSDGIHPDREPTLIALGEDNFLIPAGALRPSRGGTVFAYRGPRASDGRRVRSFRLSRKPHDGFYTVSFKLEGANLTRLQFEDPLCLPLAVIVGDDDGFPGVELTSPSFRSRRVRIPKICLGGWPWLGR